MSSIVVQIYEIQDPKEAEAVIGLGVDRIGSVILSEENWKSFHIKETILVSKGAGVKHSVIPLFNNMDTLCRVVDYYEPDILHCCESLVEEDRRTMPLTGLIELQRCIKERYPGLEFMRSVPIPVPERKGEIPTMEVAGAFEKTSDCFLTDTWLGKEPVEGFIGITGRTCDWGTARRLVGSSAIPVILAGGLSPENVFDGIMAVRPSGVDSCTRTNVDDDTGSQVRFKKDLGKVARFVEEVRRAERHLSRRIDSEGQEDEASRV